MHNYNNISLVAVQLFCKCVDYGNFPKPEVLLGASFQSVILSVSFFGSISAEAQYQL